MEKSARSGREVVAGVCAAGASVILAILVQQPSLDFFYWAVPGRKSTDGPIFVVLAYVLAIPTAIVVFRAGRSQRTLLARAATGAATGPALMILIAAFCVWAARLGP